MFFPLINRDYKNDEVYKKKTNLKFQLFRPIYNNWKTILDKIKGYIWLFMSFQIPS